MLTRLVPLEATDGVTYWINPKTIANIWADAAGTLWIYYGGSSLTYKGKDVKGLCEYLRTADGLVVSSD